MDYAKRNNAKLLVAAALVALGGCATTAGSLGTPGETIVAAGGWKCAPNCRLDIELPPEFGRPTLPRRQTALAIEGGKNVTIEAPPANDGKFMLIFEHAAFAKLTPPGQEPNDPDDVLYVIELNAGRNEFRALPAGSCPPAGCKYTIVDTKNKNRPPLDPWIILF